MFPIERSHDRGGEQYTQTKSRNEIFSQEMTPEIPPGNLNNYTLIKVAAKIPFDPLGDAFRSLGDKRNRNCGNYHFPRLEEYSREYRKVGMDQTGQEKTYAKSTSCRYRSRRLFDNEFIDLNTVTNRELWQSRIFILLRSSIISFAGSICNCSTPKQR